MIEGPCPGERLESRSWQMAVNEVSLDDLVKLIEPSERAPVTPVERLAVEILQRDGDTPLGRLLERLASEIYRQELRAGAGLLDIGLLGPKLFHSDIISELKAAVNRLWRIEKPRG